MFSKSLIVAAACVLLALGVASPPAVEFTEQETELGIGGDVYELNEDNWLAMFHGEWMLAFLAPWCQACEDLGVIWERFARESKAEAVQVASIDVTTSPWLGGRFRITTVPVIYHVKDGEFRRYRGPSHETALMNYVKKELWKKTEPVSPWMKPDTIPMTIMGFCAKVTHTLAEIKLRLHKEFGLPTWGSYGLVVIGTMCVSTALGWLFVCLMDFVNGPSMKAQRQKRNELQKEKLVENKSEEDLATEENAVDGNHDDDQQDSKTEEQNTETEENTETENTETEEQYTETENTETETEQNTDTEEQYTEAEEPSTEPEEPYNWVEEHYRWAQEHYTELQNQIEEQQMQSDDMEDKEQQYDEEEAETEEGEEVEELVVDYKDQTFDSTSWEDYTDTEPEKVKQQQVVNSKPKKPKKSKQTKLKARTKTA